MPDNSLVRFSEEQGICIVTFLSSIELYETFNLKNEILAGIRQKIYKQAIFRLEDVYFIDSSGLGIFVSVQHELLNLTKIRLCGLRSNVRLVFEYSNLFTLFNIDKTFEDSLQACLAE